jgi:hypothetical protein
VAPGATKPPVGDAHASPTRRDGSRPPLDVLQTSPRPSFPDTTPVLTGPEEYRSTVHNERSISTAERRHTGSVRAPMTTPGRPDWPGFRTVIACARCLYAFLTHPCAIPVTGVHCPPQGAIVR